MSAGNSRQEIRAATLVARKVLGDGYGYYLTQRPPAPGAHPSDPNAVVSLDGKMWHEGICQEVWGWVCYRHQLTSEEVEQYELIPDEDNPVRYQQYGIVLYEKSKDAAGRTVPRKTRVTRGDGEVFVTSYKGVAFAMIDFLNKKAGTKLNLKVIKLPQKQSTDGAPTEK